MTGFTNNNNNLMVKNSIAKLEWLCAFEIILINDIHVICVILIHYFIISSVHNE